MFKAIIIFVLTAVAAVTNPNKTEMIEETIIEVGAEEETAPYVSPEFLAEMGYNSQQNVWR